MTRSIQFVDTRLCRGGSSQSKGWMFHMASVGPGFCFVDPSLAPKGGIDQKA